MTKFRFREVSVKGQKKKFLVPFIKRITIFLFLFLMGSLAAQTSFYNILDYGEKGDGKTNNTKAINAAIDAASNNGGGTIYFPAGDFLSYTIHLQSNITLHLDNGAVLIGDKEVDGKGYDLPEETTWYAKFQDFGHSYFKNSLIYGEELHDVSIFIISMLKKG